MLSENTLLYPEHNIETIEEYSIANKDFTGGVVHGLELEVLGVGQLKFIFIISHLSSQSIYIDFYNSL